MGTPSPPSPPSPLSSSPSLSPLPPVILSSTTRIAGRCGVRATWASTHWCTHGPGQASLAMVGKTLSFHSVVTVARSSAGMRGRLESLVSGVVTAPSRTIRRWRARRRAVSSSKAAALNCTTPQRLIPSPPSTTSKSKSCPPRVLLSGTGTILPRPPREIGDRPASPMSSGAASAGMRLLVGMRWYAKAQSYRLSGTADSLSAATVAAAPEDADADADDDDDDDDFLASSAHRDGDPAAPPIPPPPPPPPPVPAAAAAWASVALLRFGCGGLARTSSRGACWWASAPMTAARSRPRKVRKLGLPARSARMGTTCSKGPAT